MSRTHEHMDEQIDGLYAVLSSFEIPVYEDEVAPDEEKKILDDYHCFVYETGDITNNQDMKSIVQSVTVYYYSENRDDLDKRTVDIMNALKDVKMLKFIRSRKQRLQKKKDVVEFVDRVIITFARMIPYGKC